MAFSPSLLRFVVIVFSGTASSASAQDLFLAKNRTTEGAPPDTSDVSAEFWRGKPCDVNEITKGGDSAAYYIYNRYHDEYMSTDGDNVELWHRRGPHALWHIKHATGHTANRFYLENDWSGLYLASRGDYNHDNVELWGGEGGDGRGGRDGDRGDYGDYGGRDGGRGGRGYDYQSHRELQWLAFAADEITLGSPRCTFYLMHSDSHRWLDTHGDNVHVWGDRSDMFEMGSEPENSQWEFVVAGSWLP